MIDFMIIALPRSGTTWAANWISCYDNLCIHDPLNLVHYSEWDTDQKIFPSANQFAKIGIACTGIWRWPDFVNSHSAKKIVLTRDFGEIQNSLLREGIPQLECDAPQRLDRINAPKIHYTDLFDPVCAPEIWRYLVGSGYCGYRHRLLRQMRVVQNTEEIEKDFEVIERLVCET